LSFFDINQVFFNVLGYAMSYLEFFSVMAGLLAVWLSAKANIWSWPIGIINVLLSFFFYYQIQLYPDMFLQVFFFVTNLMGWWRWSNPRPEEKDNKLELRVSFMKRTNFILLFIAGMGGTFLMGMLASNLHNWVPYLFNLPSSFPYTDSFILVMSIITTFLMIQKRIECWIIWIVIDIVATILYFMKGAKFFSAEYLAFTIIAAFGLWNWIREYNSYEVHSDKN
jgi:nicotinamide mononucleotide transporter